MLANDLYAESAIDQALDRWRLLHMARPVDTDVRIASAWTDDVLACHSAIETATSGDAEARSLALLALGEDELQAWQMERVEWLRREILKLARFLAKQRGGRRSLKGVGEDDRDNAFAAAGVSYVAMLQHLSQIEATTLGIVGMSAHPRDIIAALEGSGS